MSEEIEKPEWVKILENIKNKVDEDLRFVKNKSEKEMIFAVDKIT